MSSDNENDYKSSYSWLSSCATGIQRDACSFTWTIENFSFLQRKNKLVIDSTKFPCGDSSMSCWFVRLYPMGQNDDEDHCWMALHFSPEQDMTVNTNYTFFLKESDNKSFWNKQGNHTYVKSGELKHRTMKFDQLKARLKDDVLKIHIELVVFAEKDSVLQSNMCVKLSTFSSTKTVFEKCTLVWEVQNFLTFTLLPSNLLCSKTFCQTEENSRYKWRLTLEAQSETEDENTTTKILLGLESVEWPEPQDEEYPVQYRIVLKNPSNNAFVKTSAGKLLFSEDTIWYTIGDGMELTDYFANGVLHVQADILAAIGTVNVRNFTVMSNEESSQLAQNFEKMIEHAEHSDFTIFVNEVKIPTHKEILAIRSPVFRSMLQHDTLEKRESTIVIEDVNFETMMHVLRFMYTNKLSAEDNPSVIEVLKASDKYQMDDLKKICEDYLIRNLNTANARQFLSDAETYQASMLKNEARNFISLYVDDFILTFNDDL